MSHDPAQSAAAYLAGELSETERDSFEEHLLRCDECWAEVDAGRRGIAAMESLKEIAPNHLRTAIRQRVGRQLPRSVLRRRWRALAAAGASALVVGATAFAVTTLLTAESAAIAAAVSGYTQDRLPGSAMPKMPAPDLSSLRLTHVGAGSGHIDEMPVTAYAYRDPAGRRLMIYTSAMAFPMPERARPLNGQEGPWMTDRDGVVLLCARKPHELLIVGEDDELVHDAAVALDVM